MTVDLPPQRPEGKLIQDALQATGRSIRQVAPEAGLSDARWRQLVKGSMNKAGRVVEEIAPAYTLARMARAVGVTPNQLRQVGRDDAANALESLEVAPLLQGSYSHSTRISSVKDADAIDLIYESSMNATEKLEAIRKVLLLRAEADAERAAKHKPAARKTEKECDPA